MHCLRIRVITRFAFVVVVFVFCAETALETTTRCANVTLIDGAGAAVVEDVITSPLSSDNVQNKGWWKHAVIYQVYPRSFMDSNNDGIGDIKGIIQRIDYLVELGVTALWISPVYTSPMVDFGYDVSNFRAIDPIFGTMDDFDELVRVAHEKSLRIVVDFIPNHSSDKHEWFIKSCAGDAKYKDYYVWRKGRKNNTEPPNNWISHFGGPTWTYHQGRDRWYFHRYAAGQPDLNYRHAAVLQEMTDVMRFWLDRGVDGIRIDAAPNLYEHAHFPDEERSGLKNVPSTHLTYLRAEMQRHRPQTLEVIYKWREFIDEYSIANGGDERVMMTESSSTPLDKLVLYYRSPGGAPRKQGAHFSFNFWLLDESNANQTAGEVAWLINRWFKVMEDDYTSNWVWGNHDNHRLATRFPHRSRGLITLQMFLPGVAVTYQGEEIGMEDGTVTWEQGVDPKACNGAPEDFPTVSRDFERTPFQWDAGINAGFNTGNVTWLPVSDKHAECNVASQQDDPNSHLALYKELVALRKDSVLREGDIEVRALSDHILQATRRLGKTVKMLLFNFSGEIQRVDLTCQELPMLMTVVLGTQNHRTKGEVVSSTLITLQPYEATIFNFQN